MKNDIIDKINEYEGKEDMKITLGKINSHEDDLNLSESQIKGGELFEEENKDEMELSEKEEEVVK